MVSSYERIVNNTRIMLSEVPECNACVGDSGMKLWKKVISHIRMFGGLCFMLNGNMVAGTSQRGLLTRVGKEQHARA
jgi:hypothetical protein